MKKSPHIIWVCPSNGFFYRAKGEVKSRPGSVLPKISEHGIKVDVLIPFDATLLPKTKLSPSRSTRHVLRLGREYPVDIIKLSKGSLNPGVFMLKSPMVEPAIKGALLAKGALALANQIRKPVDVFHFFDWNTALLPLFLEMEKNGSKIFENTRTFLSIRSLHDQGNFAPSMLSHIGVPEVLFHPEGVEYYGQLSYLKTGLLFSDGIGLVEGRSVNGSAIPANRKGINGVLDTQMHKLRRWASDRSFKSYIDAYNELIRTPKPKPLLPVLIQKFRPVTPEPTNFLEMWGPPAPDRYGVNTISFLTQSPRKAFCFWEWSGGGLHDFGIALENCSSGQTWLLARGLASKGEYWINVDPDCSYRTALVGWSPSGMMHVLLTSNIVRTPREGLSANTNAIFIDTRLRRRFGIKGTQSWESLLRKIRLGATSALEWVEEESPLPGVVPMALNLPSSLPSSLPGSLPGSLRKEVRYG